MKRYVTEPGTEAVQSLLARADAVGTAAITRVEVAAALIWQEVLGTPGLMATFDRQLWKAAQTTGLNVWPESPPCLFFVVGSLPEGGFPFNLINLLQTQKLMYHPLSPLEKSKIVC